MIFLQNIFFLFNVYCQDIHPCLSFYLFLCWKCLNDREVNKSVLSVFINVCGGFNLLKGKRRNSFFCRNVQFSFLYWWFRSCFHLFLCWKCLNDSREVNHKSVLHVLRSVCGGLISFCRNEQFSILSWSKDVGQHFITFSLYSIQGTPTPLNINF